MWKQQRDMKHHPLIANANMLFVALNAEANNTFFVLMYYIVGQILLTLYLPFFLRKAFHVQLT